MKDQEIQVLEQYDININSTRKTRGAVLCDTKQGLMLLKKVSVSNKRIHLLFHLCEHLREKGILRIDQIVENRDKQLVSQGSDGERYVLKQWFAGKECEVRKEEDVLLAVKNLAEIHQALRNADVQPEEEFVYEGEDLRRTYERHNRELKKVRSFIRKKVEKGEFELLFLKNYDAMYNIAQEMEKRLNESEYESLLRESRLQNRMIHGDYNYHNILMTPRGIATTNFEHFRQDVQILDLYYFMRKLMEKNQWNSFLGNKILEAYANVLPLDNRELELLAINLSYPEKFWKAANSYYRSNKVFVPIKCLEKLQVSVKQEDMRKQFLEQIFSFHL